METMGFSWARLSTDQISRLEEAERTLGGDAELLLAYHPDAEPASSETSITGDLGFARLDNSQLECLQGLERQLESLIIAYRRSK